MATYRIRCQSLDRNPERGYRSHVTNTSSSYTSNASSTDGLDGWMSDSGGGDDVTATAWRRSGGSTDKGGRILRKSGLTTSRSGQLMLSDAEDTFKRMTLERRHKDQVLKQTPDINSNLTSKTVGGSGGSNAQLADDGKVVQPAGPILTVNSVSNAAAASRTLRALSPASSRRAAAAATSAAVSGRRLSSASDSRHGRGRIDDVEQFDWSATLNLLSQLDNNGGTPNVGREERLNGSDLGQTAVDSRRTTRRADWESSTLQPSSISVSTSRTAADSRRDVPARDDRGRTSSSFSGGVSGQRGYASDSEESSDWLERQRSRMRMKIQPRTDAERRLIAELKASHEKLNLVGTGAEPTDRRRLTNGDSHDTSNSFFQSSSTTFRSTTSSHPQNSSYYGPGSSSTLPLNREHRASSELDFTARRGRYDVDEDIGGGLKVNGVGLRGTPDTSHLDRHRSTSALDRAEIIEDRLYKMAVNHNTNATASPREPPSSRRMPQQLRPQQQQPMPTLDVPQLKRSATLPHRLYRSHQMLDSGTEQRTGSRFDFSTSRTGSSQQLGPPLVSVTRPVVNNDEELHLQPIGPGYQTLEQPGTSTATRLSNINLAAEPSSFSTLPKPSRTQLYADQFTSSTTSFQPPIQTSQVGFSTNTHQHQQQQPLAPAIQITTYGSSGALNGFHQTAPTTFSGLNAVGSSATLPTGRLGGHRRTQSSVGTSYESSTFQTAGGMATLNGGTTMNGGVCNGQPAAAASTFQEGDYDRLDVGKQYQQQQQQQQQTGSHQVKIPQLQPMATTQTLPLNGHRRSHSTGFGEQFQTDTSSWNGVGWTALQQPQQQQQQQHQTVVTVHHNANYEPSTIDSRQQAVGMNGVANWNQNPAASTTFRQTTVQQEYRVNDQKQYLEQQQVRLQQEQMVRQQEQQLLQQRIMEGKAKGEEIRRQQQMLKQQEDELVRQQEIQRLQSEMRRQEQERVRQQEEEMKRQELVRQEMLRQQEMQRQQEEMRRQEMARQEIARQEMLRQQEMQRQQEEAMRQQQLMQQEELRRQEMTRQEMRKLEIQRQEMEMQRQQQMTFERQKQEEMMRMQQQQWLQQQQQKLILPQSDQRFHQQQQFTRTTTSTQRTAGPQSTIHPTLNGDDFQLDQAINEARAADVSRLMTRSAVGSTSGSAAAGGATVQPSTVLQCQTVGPAACGMVSSFQTASNTASTSNRTVLISPDDYTIKQFPVDPRGLREPLPGETGRRYTGAAENAFESRYETGSWQNQQSPTLAGAGAMTFQRISGASSGTERSSAELGTISSIDSSVFLDCSIEPPDLQRLSIKFVKDTSGIWYKPDLTRDEVVAMLRECPPGSFIVRNSNSFPGAFALAVRISQLTPNMQAKGDPADGLVRHFLVESTAKGVRLRGHKNEPVFGSLAALIYQHSLTAISLPCKLLIPAAESNGAGAMSAAVGGSASPAVPGKEAACLVVYVNTVDVESLTGPEAIDRAIKVTLDRMTGPGVTTTLAHFKLSAQGITLTDNRHRIFFRRHYNLPSVIFCGMDTRNRRWTQNDVDGKGMLDSRMFGFVSRKPGGNAGNECHILAEYEPEQPAADIVDFVQKILVGQRSATLGGRT